jgi:hypothetical protein
MADETVATPAAIEAAPVAETGVVAEVKAVAGEVVAEVEKVAERLKVEISDAEKVIVLRQENQFLQLTTQARELQKQIETIQKNFPEYIKGLATKYELEIKDYVFDSISGVFNKTVKQ